MISGADPVADPVIASGCGRLEVRNVFGLSTAVTAWASEPLKLLTPRSRGPSVWAYLSSFGGGLVAGDRNRLTVEVGRGARCFLGTQASTKVYRNPHRRPCGQKLRARLADGSLLVLAPDPVQAFAGATYDQDQEFHLDPGASLALVDGCSSGRAARGERWAFGCFRSRNQVSVNNRCEFIDTLRLDSSDGVLCDPSRLGRFNAVAMLLLMGPLLADRARALVEECRERPVQPNAPLVCSASPVRNGALLRLAAERVEPVLHELRRQLEPLAPLLGDEPWARKW